MMMGGIYGMLGSLILGVFLLLGFAYIVWILAVKETAGIKLTGQIISIVIAVLALLILLYGLVNSGRMSSWHNRMMMQPGTMMQQKMMQNPDMHKMMEHRK
jgi:hypothetical protein